MWVAERRQFSQTREAVRLTNILYLHMARRLLACLYCQAAGEEEARGSRSGFFPPPRTLNSVLIFAEHLIFLSILHEVLQADSATAPSSIASELKKKHRSMPH